MTWRSIRDAIFDTYIFIGMTLSKDFPSKAWA
jgi:hypothetical protein